MPELKIITIKTQGPLRKCKYELKFQLDEIGKQFIIESQFRKKEGRTKISEWEVNNIKKLLVEKNHIIVEEEFTITNASQWQGVYFQLRFSVYPHLFQIDSKDISL